MAATLTAVRALSLTLVKFKVLDTRANNILRKPPKAAASVGVIIPAKIEPSVTVRINNAGAISINPPSFSLILYFIFGGHKSGLTLAMMTTVII